MAATKPKAGSATDIDLNSKNATHTPRFDFTPLHELTLPIVILRCSNPLATCVMAKQWLYTHFDSRVYETKDLLRMDSQELDNLKLHTEGTLLILEGVATLQSMYGGRRDSGAGEMVQKETSRRGVPVGIMALFMPRDSKIRWYYAVHPFTTLLEKMGSQELIEVKKALEPGSKAHRRLYIFVREEFLTAVKIPEHPDYLSAIAMTDYALDIRDPDTALERLWKHGNPHHKDAMDLEDDRYLLELTPPEREVASLVQLHCAEYLMVKRMFFKDFYTDVYRSDKNKEKGERVRTDNASVVWMEEVYGWRPGRAKRMIAAWKELGLLDESRLLPWIRKGGMLTETPIYEDDDDSDDKDASPLQKRGKASKSRTG